MNVKQHPHPLLVNPEVVLEQQASSAQAKDKAKSEKLLSTNDQ
jgi:hypothetical protein